MGKINSITWPIEPHTEAKHAILRKYLDAWLPIICRFNKRIAYIDGFAGPGKYSGGEDGSPLIAINSVLQHKITLGSEIIMLFIEAKRERCNFLESEIKKLKTPSNLKIDIKCNEFRKIMDEILKMTEGSDGKTLIPSFVFIDPFGFSGIPLDIIKRIMENRSCEVLITFMYDEINRFLSLEGNENHLKETFGTEEWRMVPNDNSEEKMKFLHGLYKKQLESASGANIKFVRSFKMKNKFNKSDYFLFFGTNNLFGLEKMKEAMWKSDKTGNFQFSDATYKPFQGVLFEDKPNFSQLKKEILGKFKGRTVSSEELGDFIVIETSFLRSHYKTSILKPLEESTPPGIKVVRGRTRKGTYPDNCIIKFL